MVQENVQLKGKVAVLKDYAASAELEVKASRETINRLAEETDSHQHHLSRNGQALEAIQLVNICSFVIGLLRYRNVLFCIYLFS